MLLLHRSFFQGCVIFGIQGFGKPMFKMRLFAPWFHLKFEQIGRSEESWQVAATVSTFQRPAVPKRINLCRCKRPGTHVNIICVAPDPVSSVRYSVVGRLRRDRATFSWAPVPRSFALPPASFRIYLYTRLAISSLLQSPETNLSTASFSPARDLFLRR